MVLYCTTRLGSLTGRGCDYPEISGLPRYLVHSVRYTTRIEEPLPTAGSHKIIQLKMKPVKGKQGSCLRTVGNAPVEVMFSVITVVYLEYRPLHSCTGILSYVQHRIIFDDW